jgi:nucleoid-associated protein YgaU
MSVATEFPPVVHIPDRARSAVLAPRTVRAPHLSVVRELAVPPLATVAPSVAPAPLRLTRRGLAVLTMAVISAAAIMLLVAHWSAASPPAPAVGASVVTVQPGDTLWSIARSVAPGRDPRDVVDHLMASNHLTSAALSPGQTLNVK